MENKGCCAEKPADNACPTGKTGGCGDMKKCCPGTILKGTFAGGIVMFIYFYVSWMLLPWHKAGVMELGNMLATAKVPVRPEEMQYSLGMFFILCLLGGALLTKILKKLQAGCCPVAGSMAIGLFVGAFSYMPNVIWFHFPLNYSLLGAADDVIAITLAGAVIGKCVLKAGACTMGKCGTKEKCEEKTGNCGDKKTSCH